MSSDAVRDERWRRVARIMGKMTGCRDRAAMKAGLSEAVGIRMASWNMLQKQISGGA